MMTNKGKFGLAAAALIASGCGELPQAEVPQVNSGKEIIAIAAVCGGGASPVMPGDLYSALKDFPKGVEATSLGGRCADSSMQVVLTRRDGKRDAINGIKMARASCDGLSEDGKRIDWLGPAPMIGAPTTVMRGEDGFIGAVCTKPNAQMNVKLDNRLVR